MYNMYDFYLHGLTKTTTDHSNLTLQRCVCPSTHFFRLVAQQAHQHRDDAELLERGDVGFAQRQLPDGADGGKQHVRVHVRGVDDVDEWNEAAVLTDQFTDARVLSTLQQQQPQQQQQHLYTKTTPNSYVTSYQCSKRIVKNQPEREQKRHSFSVLRAQS